MAKGKADNLENRKSLAHYRVLNKLGEGGMGEVYLATDMQLERSVALKVLPVEFCYDAERVRRFKQEARATSALNHPNIITIHEIGEVEGRLFIATEFVDGETLRDKINKNELSVYESVRIAEQIAAGLSVAHEAHIIHRDIKPENIMIRSDGYAKILDFGLAKLVEKKTGTPDAEAETRAQVNTRPGMIMGSVSYMSPEQARGRDIDERIDVWSLGVCLYEMLTGKNPFAGETISDSLAALIHIEPVPLDENLPAELQRIVRKTLQKDVNKRYQTAKDLLIDLEDVKEELKFQKKLEHTGAPNREETKTQILNATTTNVAHTTTSSAEYVAGEIKRHKRGLIIGFAILLFSLVGLGYRLFSNRSTNTTQIESIAVMPFVNESGNADVEYLSDGMTESLISSLSQLPKLNVKARNSVFRYKGKDTNAQQIGSELNVQAILTGRVVQRGDDLTLYLSLIDSKTENQIWGKQYNRKLTNLVVLQTEIARDVSDNLRTKLSGADEKKLAKNYTENAEAYRLYLKGLFHWNRFTGESLKKAADYFQQAIDIDDKYALAYSGLADSYNVLGINGHMPVKEAMPKVKSAAEKAVALDDQLPQAHVALGAFKYFYEWDLIRAEAELKRAMELDPGYAAPHELYGYLLRARGDFDTALAELRKAQELDPLSLLIGGDIGETLRFAGRTAEAIEEHKKVLEMDPNFSDTYFNLANAYAQHGMYEEAVVTINRAIILSDNSTHTKAVLGQIYARAGKKAAAYKVIDELLAQSEQRSVSPLDIAMIYVLLGENDKAFIWLKKAYDERAGWLIELKTEPAWEKIRSDARFQDLLRRVGLEK